MNRNYVLMMLALIISSVFIISISIQAADAVTRMSTRNNALDIEFDTKLDTIVCVTTPCPNDELTIRFFRPATNELLEHVNYCFSITPEDTFIPSTETCGHTHDGTAVHPVDLPDTGSFEFEINVEGLGIEKPYDTAYSGMALVTVTSEAGPAMQKLTVTYDENEFDVITSMSEGNVRSVELDPEFVSVIVEVNSDPIEEGELMITLPRALIDSKDSDGEDMEFIVLVDGGEVLYEEHETTETSRALTIPIFPESEEVEIVGTQVIPEFPIMIGAVMAILITVTVATSRIRNLSR